MAETLLTWLYGFCGVAGFIGYMPQIWQLWHDKTRAASTSLTTWAWWSFTGTVSFVYALLVVKDAPFILVSLSNFVGCWAVVSLAAYRRCGAGA